MEEEEPFHSRLHTYFSCREEKGTNVSGGLSAQFTLVDSDSPTISHWLSIINHWHKIHTAQ